MVTVSDLLEHEHTVTRVVGDNAYIRCPDSVHLINKGRPSRRHDSFSVNTRTGAYKCWTCGAKGGMRDLCQILGYDYAKLRWHLNYDRAPATGSRGERHSDPVECSWIWNQPLPPADELARRALKRSVVDDLGIRWWKDGYVIPVGDAMTSELVGYEHKRSDSVRSHGPKGAHLFGRGQTPHRTALVLESPLDVARFYSASRLPVEAVATYGANVTARQLELLRSYDRLIVAMDNDAAGHRATEVVSALDLPTVALGYAGTSGSRPGGDLGDMKDHEIERAVAVALDSLGVLGSYDWSCRCGSRYCYECSGTSLKDLPLVTGPTLAICL